MRSAQCAYDTAEPPEVAQIVRLSSGATLAHLATLLDEHGIDDLRVKIRGGRYYACASTDDCEEEALASDLAEAIQDAICAVATAQREIDSEEERDRG
jgi:hypothetical protein